MKYIFIAAIAITLYVTGMYASTVISTCYSSGDRYEYVLGEPVAGNTITDNMLTAGFLQGVIEVVKSGVEDAVKDDNIAFRLFPNPVKATLIISRTGDDVTPHGDMEFCIFGNDGAMIYRRTLKNDVSEIDLSHIADGMYIVCIRNTDGMKIFKSKIIKRNP